MTEQSSYLSENSLLESCHRHSVKFKTSTVGDQKDSVMDRNFMHVDTKFIKIIRAYSMPSLQLMTGIIEPSVGFIFH